MYSLLKMVIFQPAMLDYQRLMSVLSGAGLAGGCLQSQLWGWWNGVNFPSIPQVRDEMEEAVKGCYDHSRVAQPQNEGTGWMNALAAFEPLVWVPYTEICWTVGYMQVSLQTQDIVEEMESLNA